MDNKQFSHSFTKNGAELTAEISPCCWMYPDGFFIVRRGAVKLYRINLFGKEQVIHVFRR